MKKSAVPKIGSFTKIQVASFVKMKLRTNGAWASSAVQRIYDCQTKKEKSAHASFDHNGIGFSGYDAPLLSHLVCRIRKHTVSEQDIATLRAIMPKYWAQVVVLSNPVKLEKALVEYYKRDLPF